MSFNEDYDREGRDDEGHCTVCGVSFRGRRVLSAHLGRSQQCSASSEVLGDDEGPPAVGRLTCSLTLGGRNERNDNF
jgi:hypothetical protein